NGISHEAWIGSLRKRPSIRPYRAPGMPHLEELKRPVRQLEELESIVIGEVTRPAHRIAAEHGMLPIRNGCSGCRILGLRGVIFLLPYWSHRRHIVAQLEAVVIVLPRCRQVARL